MSSMPDETCGVCVFFGGGGGGEGVARGRNRPSPHPPTHPPTRRCLPKLQVPLQRLLRPLGPIRLLPRRPIVPRRPPSSSACPRVDPLRPLTRRHTGGSRSSSSSSSSSLSLRRGGGGARDGLGPPPMPSSPDPPPPPPPLKVAKKACAELNPVAPEGGTPAAVRGGEGGVGWRCVCRAVDGASPPPPPAPASAPPPMSW